MNLSLGNYLLNFLIQLEVHLKQVLKTKFTRIILEIEFICLNKILIEKVKKLFNECKIDVNKIVSFDYAKKFLNQDKDYTLCVSAKKILNGANQSEIYFMDISSKKPSLFHKIFNFFD